MTVRELERKIAEIKFEIKELKVWYAKHPEKLKNSDEYNEIDELYDELGMLEDMRDEYDDNFHSQTIEDKLHEVGMSWKDFL